MSQDYPPLALDDLVHLMSPSPVPQITLDDPDMPPRTKSTSPEPLPESDIIQMHRKVVEMCHDDKPDARFTPREKELVEMVLRLTAVVGHGPDQLLRQAEMISALMHQRDLLLHHFDEQRLRWNSEKDGWARMAEALLAQQTKNRFNPERDEDFERLHAAETDNKGLRQRLHETQSRLQVLESELTKLRPLLLMQPLISRSSFPLPTLNPKTQYARRRKKDTGVTEDEDQGASEGEPSVDPHDTPLHTPYSQATPKHKTRKLEATSNAHPITNPHKRRPSQKAASRGVSADARVEHLLLAARKIGKQRAGVMAGMVQQLEERERERKREESAATVVAGTPKTPKRNTGYPPEAGYVYLNSQLRPGAGVQPVPMFIPAYPHHLLQTPSSSTTAPSVTSSAQTSAQKSQQDARMNNPPTPLDSLLSAARSMMREDIDVEVDEDEEIDVVGDSPRQTPGPSHARPEELGSPVSKRRKITARATKLTPLQESTSQTTENVSAIPASASRTTNTGVGRFRSALDVLADQAAAFSTQGQPPTPLGSQTQTLAKGKGKTRSGSQLRDSSSSTSKSRGKTKSRRNKEPEVDTHSSVAPTSRSRTPQSDTGDNSTRSTRIAQPQFGGPASEAQVDPGGRASSDNISQIFGSTAVSERNQANHNAESPGSQDASVLVDDPADTTPRQGSRQSTLGKEAPDGARGTVAASRPGQIQVPLMEENVALSQLPQSEATPSGGENSRNSGPTSAAPARNKELARITEQGVPALPPKRQRSPYIKWSKEEDDLLAQAVAKYGQKWDLVQKALPSRGYHQVRQRWLRKLGVFDSKPDLSQFQTATTTFTPTPRGDGSEPRGNPKLGLAPLSSEKAFSGVVGRPPSLPS